ncbi:MAG: hypothetical protein AVDCRST_MAG39-2680 [uncultured Sphingomonadaceae bacterium]|uniref:Short-chain dehydrogenase/reductase SDR n=1 Tax=uncultured Sphingomonadaceae bacterium TaxID=169976 RepID=A0A6J4THK0_9SPHN|nr:MAG: hypothetical protein AVDCRST_MAG39-2680 [uncultured Sphingomonadaceae bacterium]
MSKIFITGSSQGLGLLAARRLAADGHQVVLPARSDARAVEAARALSAAAGVVIGDVSTLGVMRTVAERADALGPFRA